MEATALSCFSKQGLGTYLDCIELLWISPAWRWARYSSKMVFRRPISFQFGFWQSLWLWRHQNADISRGVARANLLQHVRASSAVACDIKAPHVLDMAKASSMSSTSPAVILRVATRPRPRPSNSWTAIGPTYDLGLVFVSKWKPPFPPWNCIQSTGVTVGAGVATVAGVAGVWEICSQTLMALKIATNVWS